MVTMREQVRMSTRDAVVTQAVLLLQGKRKWLTGSQVKLDKYEGKNIGLTLSPAAEALPYITVENIRAVRDAVGHTGPDPEPPSSRWTACPRATAACRAACVGKGGQGRLTSSQIARIGRTLAWFAAEKQSEQMIARELARQGRKGDPVWFRANVATDNAPRAARIVGLARALGADIRGYDYTAVPAQARLDDGVTRVLSYKGTPRSMRECVEHLARGGRVAVVFDIRSTDPKPATWHGYPVRDGDQHDVWPLFSGPGEVVGLYLKGTGREREQARAAGFAYPVPTPA